MTINFELLRILMHVDVNYYNVHPSLDRLRKTKKHQTEVNRCEG
jgi:hypothetical protein